MTAVVWAGVLLCGGVGATLRLVVDGFVQRRTNGWLPFGTLVINVSGSLALGLIAGLMLSEDAALLAGTGLIGSYTTFSTWVLETQRLGEERQLLRATANVVLSLIAGIAAAKLGLALGSSGE